MTMGRLDEGLQIINALKDRGYAYEMGTEPSLEALGTLVYANNLDDAHKLFDAIQDIHFPVNMNIVTENKWPHGYPEFMLIQADLLRDQPERAQTVIDYIEKSDTGAATRYYSALSLLARYYAGTDRNNTALHKQTCQSFINKYENQADEPKNTDSTYERSTIYYAFKHGKCYKPENVFFQKLAQNTNMDKDAQQTMATLNDNAKVKSLSRENDQKAPHQKEKIRSAEITLREIGEISSLKDSYYASWRALSTQQGDPLSEEDYKRLYDLYFKFCVEFHKEKNLARTQCLHNLYEPAIWKQQSSTHDDFEKKFPSQ
jgi:hypothetical protein